MRCTTRDAMSGARPILIVPGYRNSGPGHWQTHLEANHARARRVNLPSFDDPSPDEWIEELDRSIAACEEPPVLVAHSLGCIAVAHWARGAAHAVRAGFLVAPCDVDQPGTPYALRAFAPLPLAPLEFPAVVVASTNDPYLERERARVLAQAWGADLLVIENGEHLNAASGYGAWPAGEALLRSLL